MQIKELKDVVSAKAVSINIEYGVYDIFFAEDCSSEYKNEIGEDLLDEYGEKVIEQLYADNDGYINIDIQ